MKCPQCDSVDLLITEYDNGIDPDTGYADAGTRVTCQNCGAISELDEIDTEAV